LQQIPQDHLGRELPALELLALPHDTRAAIRLVATTRLPNPDPPRKLATDPGSAVASLDARWGSTVDGVPVHVGREISLHLKQLRKMLIRLIQHLIEDRRTYEDHLHIQRDVLPAFRSTPVTTAV